MDSFFARDIQRLFGFRDINRFNALLRVRPAPERRPVRGHAGRPRPSGITRPTVESHLRALEITHARHAGAPVPRRRPERTRQEPKVYAFDTGFVSFARGWDPLRPDDFGVLWEHMVLEHLQAHFPGHARPLLARQGRPRSGLRARAPARRGGRHRVQVGSSGVRQLRAAGVPRLLPEGPELPRHAVRRPGLHASGSATLDVRVCTPVDLPNPYQALSSG